MKHRFFVFLILIFLPFTVTAKTKINNSYIETTVLQNGDILVKELWYVNGDYNQLERTINFQDDSIFSADDIELINIKGITIDKNLNYDYLFHDGVEYKKVDSNKITESETYKLEKYTDSMVLTIYSSTIDKKAFYIEYILKNKVVKNNDVAEVQHKFFEDEFDIDNLEIEINIKGKSFQIYPKGFSKWNIRNTNNKSKIKLNQINKPISIQYLFDLDAVSNNKFSYQNRKDTIKKEYLISIFDMNHDLSNEQSRLINQTKVLSYCWLTILGIMIIIYLIKNTKIKIDYNRLPSKEDPSLVNYLITKKVTAKSLLGTIISMIADQKIVLINDNNEYILKKGKEKTDTIEEKLIKFIFEEDLTVTLPKLREKIEKYPAKASEELGSFYSRVIVESKMRGYYQDNINKKIIKIIYGLIGIIIGIFLCIITYQKSNLFYYSIIVLILSLIATTIFINQKERTKKGREEYFKWMGFKNHMKRYKKNIENQTVKNKLFAYGIVLDIDKNLNKKFNLTDLQEIKKQYNKILNKKIAKILKKSHKIEAGTSNEDTTKFRYNEGDKK